MTEGGILYLDPSLGAAGGHHGPLARAFSMLAGRSIIFGGARTNRPWGRPEPAVFLPVFGYRVEDAFRVSGSGAAWRGLGVGRWLARAARRLGIRLVTKRVDDLSPLFRGFRADSALSAAMHSLPRDVVVMGADPATLSALRASAGLSLPSAPQLHLVFMYPERDFLPDGGADSYFALVREMLRWPRPPLLYAELAEHAADLAAALGAPVQHQILPYRWPSASVTQPSEAFTVAVLGAGRADKGFAGLPEIVAAARDSGVRFRIQRPSRFVGLGRATRALSAMSNVTLLPAELTDEVYDAELAGAHVVLIAYDPDRYARRGSGVFVDALMFGRPIVCVANTALARMLSGNGLTAEDAPGFASAFLEARQRYDALMAAAAHARECTMSAIRNGPLFVALRAGQGEGC